MKEKRIVLKGYKKRKRKSRKILHERPAKFVCCGFSKSNIETIDSRGLCRIKKHTNRCGTVVTFLKTLSEAHDISNNYNSITNRGEHFLFINSAETNVIVFSCDRNLNVLSQMKTVFINDTFKSCPEHFYKLF